MKRPLNAAIRAPRSETVGLRVSIRTCRISDGRASRGWIGGYLSERVRLVTPYRPDRRSLHEPSKHQDRKSRPAVSTMDAYCQAMAAGQSAVPCWPLITTPSGVTAHATPLPMVVVPTTFPASSYAVAV
jgi:hypothetical protein